MPTSDIKKGPLYVDSTNNRVGIGTSSPDTNLQINQTGTAGNNYDLGSIKIGDTVGIEVGFNNIGSGRASFTSLNNAGTTNNRISFGFGAITSGGEPTTNVMTLNQSGKVGIGTTSPNKILHLETSGETVQRMVASTTNLAGFYFGDSGNGSIGQLIYDNANDSMRFNTNSAERMRIDSGGNLQLGKTASGIGTEGITLYGDGAIGAADFTRDGGRTLALNRKTSDGDIVEFRKDTTTVGSIASRGGLGLTVDSAGANGRLSYFGTDYCEWNSTRFGAVTDNALDLGRSANRFKDLYLSGGAYLGGTGSANKLDDYEEGTWTATHGGNDMTFNSGHNPSYVKIGRLVTVCADVTSATGSSTTNTIGGLPFAPAYPHGTADVSYVSGSSGAAGGYVSTTPYAINFIQNGGTSGANISAGDRIIFKAIYYTDA